MHETDQDLEWLQRLLDESHRGAGAHLRAIFDEKSRIPAAELPALLRGVQVLNLATVTQDCRPLVTPVDGLFYRGRFYFGSSPDSVRFRHIAHRPQVSASHTRGEDIAIVVHGTATVIDLSQPANQGFQTYRREVYVPLYGEGYGTDGDGSRYARIDPDRMFTFRNTHRPG